MSWTEITRAQYRRDGLRYASDTTDAEWSLLAPLLPRPCRMGRPRTVDQRAVVNAILYILATGCQWRALPKDFPPRSTVQYYFYGWRDQRIWRRINLALVKQIRRVAGRNIVPSAGVIDSQSVKTTESGGPRGFDAAKRVKGRKRHIVTEAWVLIGSVRYGRFAARRAGARGQHPRQSWRCAAAEIACIAQPVAPILSPGDFSPRHVVAPS